MKSRYWRTIGFNLIASTLIEYAVSLCISLYFNDENEFVYALLIMLGIWAIQIALWVKNTIVTTVFYYLIGKNQSVGEIEAGLRQNEFPIYDGAMPDAVDYLGTVISDEYSNVKQIAYAAGTLGQIELLKLTRPTAAWRFMSATEKALDNYLRLSKQPRNHIW